MTKRTGIIIGLVIFFLLTQGRLLLANIWGNIGFVALNHALVSDPAGTNPTIETSLTHALDHDPHARQALSLYYLQHNRQPEALDLLQPDPNSPAWLIAWGQKAAQDNNHTQALDWYNRATTLAPDLADPHYYAALSHESLGQLDLATTAYNTSLTRTQFDTIGASDIYLQLAQPELQPDPAATITLLEQAISAHSFIDFETEVYAHYLLAETARDQAQFDRAIDEYQWIVANETQHYWARVQLGRLLWRVSDNPQLAEQLLLEAIDLIEDRKAAHKSLAELYLASGRDTSALIHYQRAFELDPLDPDIQDALNTLNS